LQYGELILPLQLKTVTEIVIATAIVTAIDTDIATDNILLFPIILIFSLHWETT